MEPPFVFHGGVQILHKGIIVAAVCDEFLVIVAVAANFPAVQCNQVLIFRSIIGNNVFPIQAGVCIDFCQ